MAVAVFLFVLQFLFLAVLLHLYFLLVIAEVTAGVSTACIHTLLEWQLQGDWSVLLEDMKSKSAAGQTHTVRRSKVTQHYAPLDTSPQQNPAKLFCPKWQRWRYSMYLGEDYKSVSNTTSLTKGRSSAADSSGKPETTLPTFTFCRYFYVSNKKVVIPKECCNLGLCCVWKKLVLWLNKWELQQQIKGNLFPTAPHSGSYSG